MLQTALDSLPSLPQVACLRRVTTALWADEEVVALWLGGSFAREEADEYSDIDLRVAVAGKDLDSWSFSSLPARIGAGIVGGRSQGGDSTIFHQLVFADGIILDLLVQSADQEPPPDFTRVLACRDPAFGELLVQAHLPQREERGAADPTIIRQVIADFWIDSHKHVKILHRGLDLMILVGLGLEQSVLIRLWYAQATGRDQGTQRVTIHSLTPTVRAVTEAFGAHSLETLGTPRGSRAEIMRAVESNRDEVAAVGRRLASGLGFEYPEALERAVRETWLRSFIAP